MTRGHVHHGPGDAVFIEPLVIVIALLAGVGYLWAAAHLRRRGDDWSRRRDGSFTLGVAGLAWAVVGIEAGGPFTAHMAQHLVVGMAAPLLLVLGRPVTLALRALPPGRRRRGLLAVVHSRCAEWLLCPPVAAVLDVGGLWLLYRTGLFEATRDQPLLHAVVHAHVLAAGLLFTVAICQLDPVRRRWSLMVRGGTLLATGAVHAVLAKSLYATPPAGTAFDTTDLHAGARLMYYGGDLVELALAVILAVQWFTATGRALTRARRARAATPALPSAR
ncbi:cytochrome c oxidase assembly protein [Lentzea sp. E54]|uniref:cytochrome c oxidase assembly protein n=1 Tax=Lentzea xerophila TaxID=3435883 RepID=UPI003DA69988